MNLRCFFIIVCLFFINSTIFSDTELGELGFGQQPIMVNPQNVSKNIYNISQYKLTAGDLYELQLVFDNKTSYEYPLFLEDNYKLNIPYIGIMDIKDMTFSDLRSEVLKKIKAKVPLQYVDLLLKSPALFDVFIYGGVENPGFVTAIPINRVSDAIALAKGFKKGGSFRQVHLIRGEEDIILDLSRFSANADLSQNPFLEPGDKIYIPHAEVVVSLSGGVKYPGTYELIPGETLEDLLHYAGGTLPGSANTNFFVARVAENGKASMEEIEQSKAKDFMLKNGDNISLKSAMIVEVGATIFIEGAVFGQPPEENKPTQIPTVPVIANLPYVPGITLLNLVEKLGGPTPFARAGESYIIKKKDNSKFPVDLETLWQTRDLSMDIVLEPGDHVVIPIKELKVFVAGQVNAPGAIPFMTGLTVSDYIKAAGGINVDDGSADSIYFIDKAGNRQKASLLDEAYAGALIYVDKNAWRVTQDTFDNILVITAFVGGVVLLTNTILDLVDRVN